MCKHRFEVQLLPNPPLCSRTEEPRQPAFLKDDNRRRLPTFACPCLVLQSCLRRPREIRLSWPARLPGPAALPYPTPFSAPAAPLAYPLSGPPDSSQPGCGSDVQDDLDEDEDDEDEEDEEEEVDEVELGPLPLLLLAVPSDDDEFVKGRDPPLFVFTSPTAGTPRPIQACTSTAVTYSPRLLR
jgi:hypothetical protein